MGHIDYAHVLQFYLNGLSFFHVVTSSQILNPDNRGLDNWTLDNRGSNVHMYMYMYMYIKDLLVFLQ